MRRLFLAAALTLPLALAACSDEDQLPQREADKAQSVTGPPAPRPIDTQLGTPMAERVAVIGLLNKYNGKTRTFELKPGQSVRYGRAIIRLRACEKAAPWETPEVGAFVQLLVNDRAAGQGGQDKWLKVFSGWLFRENPAANVVQHPVFDVWVKDCRMSFPGEETPEDDGKDSASSSSRSSAPQSPASPAGDAPAPAPSATPAVAPANPTET